jgi:LysM repeat protein
MERQHRSPLRILAPLAVVVFGLALILVIASTSSSGGGGSGRQTKLEQRDLGAKKRPASVLRALAKGTYTVKPNDTFGSIAVKTGVPLDTLINLNPDVDPQNLHAGQKIKLR